MAKVLLIVSGESSHYLKRLARQSIISLMPCLAAALSSSKSRASSISLRAQLHVTSLHATAFSSQQYLRTRHLFQSSRYLSHTRPNMAGSKIDGTSIAKGIREKLNAQIKKTQETNPRYKPALVIIQGTSFKAPSMRDCGLPSGVVGDRSDSSKKFSQNCNG